MIRFRLRLASLLMRLSKWIGDLSYLVRPPAAFQFHFDWSKQEYPGKTIADIPDIIAEKQQLLDEMLAEEKTVVVRLDTHKGD